MTEKRNRLTPAVRKLATLLAWLIGLALAACSLLSSPALAVNTGPVACSAITSPTTFANIDTTATITITGFTAGAAVTVGYRNNGTGNFDLGIVKTSGPTLNPTGHSDINITGTESVAFAYSSGSGNLVLTLNASDLNGSPVPQYQVSCSPPPTSGVTVNESGGSTNITEGGTTDSFTVVLTSQPTANVSISLTPNAQCTVSPVGPLVFTNGDWNTPQTVTVTAVNDAAVEGPHTCPIVTAATSGDANYNNITVADVTANVTDNDTAGLVLSKSTLSVNEAGTTSDTLTVSLQSQPTADVTVTVSSGDTTEGTITTSATLTFTTANWNTPQDVTLQAVNDAIDDADVSYNVVLDTASASDPVYNGLSDVTVSATTMDDDTAAVTVSPTTVSVTEGGTTANFTVVLTAQPTSDVTISLSPDAQCTLSTSSVTFDNTNWATPQSVTVTAVNDGLVEGPHTCLITTGAASSTDGNYSGKTVADVTANVTDNDTAGVTVAGSPVAITEGGATGNFTVVLTAQPTADVTIGLSADAQCTLSTSSLTFTTGNWNSPQSVTVTAVDDTDEEGAHSCAIATANAVSTDSNYNGLDVADVTANITDNDGGGALSETVVQKTFESETYNFIAARLRLLARFGPRNHRIVNRQDGEFQMGSNGLNIQGEGGDVEGNFALNTGGVRRILNGDLFSVTPTADIVEANSSTFNAWIEGQFAYYNSDDNDQGNPDGNFFVGYAGADVRVHDGVVIGIMGQLDWFDEDTDTGKTDGDGWMVGPYISARLAPNLFFDLRGMYGQSDNSSTQDIQNFRFEGDFDTDRYLVEAILTGRFDYGSTLLTPDLQFIYIWEDQEDYSVSSGGNVVNVDGQLVKLGQLSTGLKVAEQMGGDGADIWPYIGGRVLWDFDNPGGLEIDGSTVSTDDIRAAISLGLDITTQSTQISVEATYDGLFSDDYEAIGGRVTFSHHW